MSYMLIIKMVKLRRVEQHHCKLTKLQVGRKDLLYLSTFNKKSKETLQLLFELKEFDKFGIV